MSVEGARVTNLSDVDYASGGLSYGRGQIDYTPALDAEYVAEEFDNYVEPFRISDLPELYRFAAESALARSREGLRTMGQASIAALECLQNPQIPQKVKFAVAAGLVAIMLPAGVTIAESAGNARAHNASHPNKQTDTTLVVNAPAHEGPALVGGPDPDDDDPTAQPGPLPAGTPIPEITPIGPLEWQQLFLPLLAVNFDISKAIKPVPADPSPSPEPITPTPVPPSPSPSPTPPATQVPLPGFDGLTHETVFAGTNGPVVLTAGGTDAWAASSMYEPQLVGLPGTAVRIGEGDLNGFEVEVKALPLTDPIDPEAVNAQPGVDAEVSIGTVALYPYDTRYDYQQALSMVAGFDEEAVPPQWVVDKQPVCDGDEYDKAEGPLTARNATIQMGSHRVGPDWREHVVVVDAGGQVCGEAVTKKEGSWSGEVSDPPDYVSGIIRLPESTKGFEVKRIDTLRSAAEAPLIARYPDLAAVNAYRALTRRNIMAYIEGGYFKGKDLPLWGHPDSYAAFKEGYIKGMYLHPFDAYTSRVPNLAPQDLAIALAREQGWKVIVTSLINSNEGHPAYWSSFDPYSPEQEAVLRKALQETYGQFMERWHGDAFAALEQVTSANFVSLDEPDSRRRSFLNYLFEYLFSHQATSSLETSARITSRWEKLHRGGSAMLTLEQQGLFGNSNYVGNNLNKALDLLRDGDYDPAQIRLVFPVGNGYSPLADGWAERLSQLTTQYAGYGDVIIPVMASRAPASMNLLADIVGDPAINMHTIAIPPTMEEYNGPVDILTAPVFLRSMDAAVQELKDKK